MDELADWSTDFSFCICCRLAEECQVMNVIHHTDLPEQLAVYLRPEILFFHTESKLFCTVTTA